MDELARSIERGMVTETEFSESMKQRLEKGYILPGQMRELFSCKEILAKSYFPDQGRVQSGWQKT